MMNSTKGSRDGFEELDGLKNAEHIAGTIRYTQRLSDQLVALSMEATSKLESARRFWGVGVATFLMNRREFTEGGVRLGVNPRGLVDRSAPVLRIDSADGKTPAVLIGTA